MLEYDSIRTSLSKESMLAEIRMQLSAPQNENKTFVILEGIDDITMFDSLLSPVGCILYESYGGKIALNETVAETFNDKRIIGIRDIDYDITHECERIFYCDHCNAEMMMVANDSFFVTIMRKLIRHKEDFIQLRLDILNCLKYFSFTREQNDVNHWGIDLSNISVEYLISKNDPIKIDDIIDHVNIKNEIKIDNLKKEAICFAANNNRNSLLDYTNGHDFCSILKCMTKNKYGLRNSTLTKINDQDFKNFLSIGYTLDYFVETSLFDQLKKYQETNSLHIVDSHI